MINKYRFPIGYEGKKDLEGLGKRYQGIDGAVMMGKMRGLIVGNNVREILMDVAKI
jgi:hypothetical protein